MEGFGPPFGQAATPWQEHRTPEGKAYYYNPQTQTTTWTKPQDLMTAAERAATNSTWKQTTASDGRAYWYNSETQETQWDMPDAARAAMNTTSNQNGSGSQTPFTPTGGPTNAAYGHQHNRQSHDDQRDVVPESHLLTSSTDVNAKAFVPATNDPDYASPEEAEAAFVKALKRGGVQPDWTWEQAIRATAKDPQFRAIKNPNHRRAAFEQYCNDVVVQDKERAKERMAKLRADFGTMLKRHPEITHYTRWKTARPIIEGETIFRSTNNENERRQLFEEYIIGLKKAYSEKQSTMRKSAMDGILDILPMLNLAPYTRWSDAQGSISSTGAFQHDEKYQTLSQFDILTAFQNHMKSLERAFNDSKQEEKNRRFRKERKARQGFKALLRELRGDGKINAGTKWSQLVSLIEKDERYTNLVALDGPPPFELFWDVVEEEERSLRTPRNHVLDVLHDKRVDLSATNDFEEFLTIMRDDQRTANIDRTILHLIFEREREKQASKRQDEKQPDRHQRRAIDDLRAFIKRLEPPVTSNDTYDKVRSRLLKAPEFQAVSSEDFRRSAFDKHIRRLREKEDEAERGHRRRDHGSSEHDHHRRERERSRGEKHHRGTGHRRSRSPEIDSYEEHRLKNTAERERHHHKSTMAESLLSADRGRLSPSRRERERERDRNRERERDRDRDRERDRDRDRDRERDRERHRDRGDYDRHIRPRRDEDSHYDRERRDYDEERERLFRRRVDRSSVELPYGDERPSSTRRRRPEDDEEHRRDSKRVKTEKPSETTQPDAPPRKSPQPPPRDVRSGSEEGEIEEE